MNFLVDMFTLVDISFQWNSLPIFSTNFFYFCSIIQVSISSLIKKVSISTTTYCSHSLFETNREWRIWQKKIEQKRETQDFYDWTALDFSQQRFYCRFNHISVSFERVFKTTHHVNFARNQEFNVKILEHYFISFCILLSYLQQSSIHGHSSTLSTTS